MLFVIIYNTCQARGVIAFKHGLTSDSDAVIYIFWQEICWQRAVYFPLVDHLVQELNDRLLLQENRFLGQYLVPAKLNAFNSGLQVDKLYETYKTYLSEKRDFDNEILRWQTKWSHSTDEKQVTLIGTVPSSTLIRTFIPTWSQLLPSSWQCQCQLLPPNDLLARCAEWRRT